MFNVLAGEKKRRVLSPATLVASVAAHLVLVGGVMFASSGPDRPQETLGILVDLPPLPVEPVAPQPAPPAPPQPAPPAPSDEIPPKTGETVVIQPPAEVPDRIAPPDLSQTPITDAITSGMGEEGDVIGPPMGADVPLTGNNDPAPAGPLEDMVIDESMAEVRPVLDREGLSRALERNYPQRMRDAGIAGRVVLEVVVDEDGRVRPSSARVVEASNPQFGDAALRAAERLRFRPARVGGVPVAVRVNIPIAWSVAP